MIETRLTAWTAAFAIAYAGEGDGPRDLVFAHGGAGNIEIEREIPFMRAFHDACSAFSRLIVFDKRGTGLSDGLRQPASALRDADGRPPRRPRRRRLRACCSIWFG